MKTLIKTIFIISIATGFFACSKNAVPPTSTVASLSFVNATVGVSPVVVRIGNPNTIYSKLASSNTLSYGTTNLFSPVAGTTNFSFVQTADTSHTLFSANLNLQNANIYSLYLAGTVAQPDTVFIHEKLPVYSQADSVAGIRFINLSAANSAVSVDIQGQANGSEVTNLAYKGRTGFKSYKADHTVPSYVFEFRDLSGNVLATYTLSGVANSTGTNTTANKVRFHNQTIALIGGGAAATSAIVVPNY